ncbi:MAG: manno-octulosonate cytidylyltransferase [Pseudomonadota bacterium]
MTVIVIPARYASTRYPGKPLVALRGPDGAKPLIQRTWEVGMAVPGVQDVFVATDDVRIADVVQGFGGQVIMTDSACRNGTERCADAVAKAQLNTDLVVNLQGDAPLTPPWFLSDLITAMQDDPTLDAATPVLRCDAQTLATFQEDRQNGRVGGTTAVMDHVGRALYFSKEIIPYIGDRTFPPGTDIPVFHHVGVYAYRPAALARYASWPEGPLETLEGLEQLRFLEQGAVLKSVQVHAQNRHFWELNNPEDVARIEAILAKDPQ